MHSEMIIEFPGGKKVDARLNGHVIKTDQSVEVGGEGSAPEPYALFLASIGTCAGIYVKSFCDARNIPTDRIKLKQRMHFDPVQRRMAKIELEIDLPPDFPQRYREPLKRAASLCTVKKTIENPPDFVVNASVAGS